MKNKIQILKKLDSFFLINLFFLKIKMDECIEHLSIKFNTSKKIIEKIYEDLVNNERLTISQLNCETIPLILKKSNLLGEGYHGSVYSYFDYAIKIQKQTFLVSDDFKLVNIKQNKLAKLGLAPKIYKIIECKNPNKSSIYSNDIIIMDLIKGLTLENLMLNDKLTIHIIDELFDKIKFIHKNKIIHGDMLLSNIIYSNGKIIFIDPSDISFDKNEQYIDYERLLKFLIWNEGHMKNDLLEYFFDKIRPFIKNLDEEIEYIRDDM